jgi:hypothetical protein
MHVAGCVDDGVDPLTSLANRRRIPDISDSDVEIQPVQRPRIRSLSGEHANLAASGNELPGDIVAKEASRPSDEDFHCD